MQYLVLIHYPYNVIDARKPQLLALQPLADLDVLTDLNNDVIDIFVRDFVADNFSVHASWDLYYYVTGVNDVAHPFYYGSVQDCLSESDVRYGNNQSRFGNTRKLLKDGQLSESDLNDDIYDIDDDESLDGDLSFKDEPSVHECNVDVVTSSQAFGTSHLLDETGTQVDNLSNLDSCDSVSEADLDLDSDQLLDKLTKSDAKLGDKDDDK